MMGHLLFERDPMPPATGPEYTLPRVEALLAATLALMTGHAQSRCTQQRHLMALKVRNNLLQLSAATDAGSPFRAVVQHVPSCWEALATDPAASADLLPERRLWHTTA